MAIVNSTVRKSGTRLLELLKDVPAEVRQEILDYIGQLEAAEDKLISKLDAFWHNVIDPEKK